MESRKELSRRIDALKRNVDQLLQAKNKEMELLEKQLDDKAKTIKRQTRIIDVLHRIWLEAEGQLPDKEFDPKRRLYGMNYWLDEKRVEF